MALITILQDFLSIDNRHNTFETCLRLLRRNKFIQIIVAIFGLTALRNIAWKMHRKINKLPPGPIGWPIFGVFFNIAYDALYPLKMSKKYGPITFLPNLGLNFVLLGDTALVKQLLPQKEFLNRSKKITNYQGPWKSIFSVGKNGNSAFPFFFLNGNSWVTRRKYATSVT